MATAHYARKVKTYWKKHIHKGGLILYLECFWMSALIFIFNFKLRKFAVSGEYLKIGHYDLSASTFLSETISFQ